MSRITRLAGGTLGGAKGDLKPGAGINDNLIFCLGSHPAGSDLLATELVSRNAFTLGGGAAMTADHPDESWKSLDLATADDYALWSVTSALEAALDGANTYSFAIYAEVFGASESFATFFALPYNDGSHSSPFHTLTFSRNGSSAQVTAHFWYDGTSLRNFNNDSGGPQGDMWRPDGSAHWLIGTRANQDHALYLDGVEQHSETGVTGGNISFNGSGSSKIVIGTRNDQDLGESLVGEVYALAIWDRELSSSDASSLNTDPTQMFIT